MADAEHPDGGYTDMEIAEEVGLSERQVVRIRHKFVKSMNACGDTCTRSTSDVRVFCSQGVIFTNIWGHFLNIQRPGQAQPEALEVPKSMGVWQQFLAVRSGEIVNPCPPEVGLRMAKLWDAIRLSAQQSGKSVLIG